MRRTAGLWVLAAVLVVAARASDKLTVGLDEVARDGPDRLLGFSRAWNQKLAVYEDGRWSPLPFPSVGRSAQPRGLSALNDGRVASLWAAEKGGWLVAILERGRVTRTVPFAWPVGSWDRVDMMVTSDDRIWLSAGDPRVVWVDPATGEVTIFDLSPHQGPGEYKKWNMTGVVEDGRGDIWIWSRHRADNYHAAAGLFRVRDQTLEPVSRIAGFAGQRVMDLVPRDRDSLWLVDRWLGLSILSLADLRAEIVPPPDRAAFPSILRILPLGDDWLVVAGSGRDAGVWRLADGKWSERYPAEGWSFVSWDREAPPSAIITSGRLLGLNVGILFVPKDGGAPRLLDWRVGFPLTAPRQILALDDDRFVAISGGGSPPRWIVADLNDFAKIRLTGEAQDIMPLAGWAVDSGERVFARLPKSPEALSMWNDGEWREIPLPAGVNASVISVVERDARDRIWGFSRHHLDEPVVVLEADRKTWRVIDGFRAALVEFRDGLEGFLAEESWLRPVCGPVGEVAFRGPNWTLEFWDGRSWRTWKLDDIVPPVAMTLDPADSSTARVRRDDRVSTPFFDAEGRLSVNTLRTERTWKLGKDGRWTPHPKEDGIADHWTDNRPRRVNRRLPQGFPHTIHEPWTAEDNVGSTWVAGNGNLFRWRNGKTVKVFEEGTAHPFLANPPIYDVRVDRRGNAWIKMGTGKTARHVLLPAPSASPAQVTITADRNGFAVVEPRSPAGGLEWRIGSGPWRGVPAGGGELGYLPPGSHRIEVRLVDDRLNVHSLPPIAVQGVPDSEAHLAHLVKILANGPADRREFAVAALEACPDAALPVLDQALAKNPADRWWLEAARQACQRVLSGR